jgi:alcohol dehydrogenase
MKAAFIDQYGGTDAIRLATDLTKPSPGVGQVLVNVQAASLNRVDTFFRAGYLQEMVPLSFPFFLAGDFAGVITQVGEEVTGLSVGDEVYGQAGAFYGGKGALAEFVVAPANNLAKRPKSISVAEAASLPLTAASALQAIEDHMGVQKGQKVLIHGGTGGVGSIAIQLAKYHGAYVATTVAGEFTSLAKDLGADEVIDFQTQDFATIVKDYDAVLVNVADAAAASYKILKKGGVLVSLAGAADENAAQEQGVTAISQMTQTSAKQLERIAQLVDSGVIKPLVDKTFSLEETQQAFDYFEKENKKGKVVVTIG